MIVIISSGIRALASYWQFIAGLFAGLIPSAISLYISHIKNQQDLSLADKKNAHDLMMLNHKNKQDIVKEDLKYLKEIIELLIESIDVGNIKNVQVKELWKSVESIRFFADKNNPYRDVLCEEAFNYIKSMENWQIIENIDDSGSKLDKGLEISKKIGYFNDSKLKFENTYLSYAGYYKD